MNAWVPLFTVGIAAVVAVVLVLMAVRLIEDE